MKVKLTSGEAQFRVRYDEVDKPKHLNGRRMTTLTVTLPSGEVLMSKVVCHTGDQFSRRQGRKLALLKIILADNQQAEERTVKEYQNKPLKTEVGNLSLAARKYYKLSREDRKILFREVCPEYYRNTPERRAMRDKLLFERLKVKFDQQVKSTVLPPLEEEVVQDMAAK